MGTAIITDRSILVYPKGVERVRLLAEGGGFILINQGPSTNACQKMGDQKSRCGGCQISFCNHVTSPFPLPNLKPIHGY